MFKPQVFQKQMYCIGERTCNIVRTFRRPCSHFAPSAVIWGPHSDSALLELCPLPPSFRPCLYHCFYKFNVTCVRITRPHYFPLSQAQDDLQRWIPATETLGAICCSHNAVLPWATTIESRTDDPSRNSNSRAFPTWQDRLCYCCYHWCHA